MRIGIDARLYSQTGVGRYIRNLIYQLKLIDTRNYYVIFLNSKDYGKFELPSGRWEKRKVDIHWHSLAEQTKFPNIILREKCDLIHFPYFSIPLLYDGKFIVTVHDLIMNHFDTGRVSTWPTPIYKIKQLGYKIVFKNALSKSCKIITVSQASKRELIKHYHVPEDKIIVTYEASEPRLANVDPPKNLLHPTPRSYILYVGNAYPHKNLNRLLNVFKNIQERFPKIQLVMVGQIDTFYKRLEKETKVKKVPRVTFTGEVTDNNLAWLYSNALCFVFPSLMEGFGLPPLEAMSYGCPVVAANVSSIPEVCDEACLYFDPTNEIDIEQKITQILDDKNKILKEKLIQKGFVQIKRYNWEKTALETLKAYESCSSL